MVLFYSCLYSQADFEKHNLDFKRFGTEMGSFVNISYDQVEIDGYLELKTRFGIFTDVWFDQVDLDTGTNIQRYSSLGYMNDFSDDFIFGFGYANSKSQSEVVLHEVFGGLTLNKFTSIAYFNILNQEFNFLASYDLSSLTVYKNIDISLDSFIYDGNMDLFIRISKTFNTGFTFGNVISRENYSDIETKSIIKNGNLYEYSMLTEKKGYFYLIYFGFIFN